MLAAPLALNLGAKAGQYDPVPMNGADVTAHDVAVTLFKTKAGEPVDYSNHKLMYLDLSGLDFKGARFTHADLYGTDFTGRSSRHRSSHTRLDRSVLSGRPLRCRSNRGHHLPPDRLYGSVE